MKKDNQMNDEYAALCKQIRTQMKKDFVEYRRWKKGKISQESAENMQEDETTLEDFEREMEEEFLEENTGKEDAISSKNFGIALDKSAAEEKVEIFQEEEVEQQNVRKTKEQANIEQRLVRKTEKHALNVLYIAEASEKAKTRSEQQQKVVVLQEELQEVEASEGAVMKLKELSGTDGILETTLDNEIEKMRSEEAVQANNEKCAGKESVAGPSSNTEWKGEPRMKGRYGAAENCSALNTVPLVSLR